MSKIKLPLGLRDEFGEFATKKDYITAWLLNSFQQRGYLRVKTPVVEQKSLFKGFDTTNKQYRVFDPAGDDLVLRPDLTLPIARFLSNVNIKLPQKIYYSGDKFEISPKLSGGKNTQTQVGVELIGFNSLKAEMEEVIIMHQLNRHFLKRHQLTIEIGHAKLVDKVLAELHLDHKMQTQLAEALYHKNFPAYAELLNEIGPCDEIPFLQKWPRLFGTVSEIRQTLKNIRVPEAAKPILKEVVTLAEFTAKLPEQKVIIDLSSKVPQKYYTGIIFKGYTAKSNQYVVSGGRYNKLLANFETELEPAVGLGINIDAFTSIADVKLSNQRPVFVYANFDDLAEVSLIIEKNQNYSLSLADNLKLAKEQAAQANAKLMIWNKEEGLIEC